MHVVNYSSIIIWKNLFPYNFIYFLGSVFKPILSNNIKVLESEPVKNTSNEVLNSELDSPTNANSLEDSNVKGSAENRLDEAKKEITTVVHQSKVKSKRKKKNSPIGSKSKRKKPSRNSVSVDIFDDDST